MDKFLVICNNGLARNCKTLEEAKYLAKNIIDDECDEVTIYEKKLVASIEKPKVEFKEV